MRKHRQKIALTLAILMFIETIAPLQVYALTSGPSQPEYSSFTPVGSSDMVDLFTGDFSYNIPLLEVPGPNGGYPLNLSYHSPSNYEEEASMVGLGWNINIGAITRNMRGLPDDFDGDKIETLKSRKADWTVGVDAKLSHEFFTLSNSGEKESSESADSSLTPNFNVNVSPFFNSYKGFGLRVGLDATFVPIPKGPLSTSFGTEFNSQEGLGYNASIGLDPKWAGLEKSSLTFGFNGNSMEGLKSLNFSTKVETQDGKNKFQGSSSLALPLSTPTYTINNPSPMKGANFTFSLLTGLSLFGFNAGLTGTGYFTTQSLRNNNDWLSNPSYGYLYLQEGQDDVNATLDFNRLKDRPIKKHHQNLAVPMNTKDYFSLSAQGTSSMFSVDRNDIGIYRDKKAKSVFGGGSLKGSVGGGGFFDGGADASLNYSSSVNDVSDLSAFTNSNLSFQNIQADAIAEPYFFKVEGEMVENNNANSEPENVGTLIDNNEAIDFNIAQVFNPNLPLIKQYTIEPDNMLKKKNGTNYGGNQNALEITESVKPNRQIRSNIIKHYTWDNLNKRSLSIGDEGGVDVKNEPLIPYFKIDYTDESQSGNSENVTVEGPSSNKIAAFTEIKSDGTKYNFGLPIYNLTQVEATFSVEEKAKCETEIDIPINTDPESNNDPIKSALNTIDHDVEDRYSEDLLDCKIIPPYTHSHLLTSVLGTDYIDVDPSDGEPNESDLGYWVKFKYLKKENFKWRIPYGGANYSKGFSSIGSDDKAYFTYGEREQYYPDRIETSSHFLEFIYVKRQDNRGANGIITQLDETPSEAYSYALQEIILYAKLGNNLSNKKKIKSIEFDTDYFDQDDVPNANTGKLKLNEVIFRNYDSNRGSLNPYTFDYKIASGEDKVYHSSKKDRWGVYKARLDDESECLNNDFPYTKQDSEIEDATFWHLEKINLPSGATVNVDISRDHYSHVQDRNACEMMQIKGVHIFGRDNIPRLNTTSNKYRVFFELKQHPNSEETYPIEDYFKDVHWDLNGPQIIFKIKSRMTDENSGYYEYLTGGAYFNGFGVHDETTGWVDLVPYDKLDIDTQSIDEDHPFVVSSWQFLKTYLARLTNPGEISDPNEPDEGDTPGLGLINRLISQINGILNIFRNFYTIANDDNYGRSIILEESYLRLNSPDQKKYGGNVKVDAIRISSNWDEEITPEYGNVYDYSTTIKVQENGEEVDKIISSGVAANEPAVGNEENAYKYMKHIDVDIKKSTEGMVFEEHPYNDVYFPSAQVGYREVKVRSLASQYHNSRFTNEQNELEGYSSNVADELDAIETNAISSTGQAIHEFYTAKDYPVITKETKIESKEYWPSIIVIPFIAVIKKNAITATQGYVIEKNDMHGKPKSVSYYGQEKSGAFLDDAVSSVEYIYHDKEIQYRQGTVSRNAKQLKNTVQLHNTYDGVKEYEGELGIHRSLELDLRHHESISESVGIDFDVNGFPFGIFPLVLPTVLPDFSYKSEEVKTGVTNKVINRKGILKKIIASDGTSIVETENLVFDPFTGSALVSSVNNSFDNKVYSYNVPAHHGYPRMGPAYTNIGYTYNSRVNLGENTKTNFIDNGCDGLIEVNLETQVLNSIVSGDELIVKIGRVENGFEYRAIFEKQKDETTGLFRIENELVELIDFMNFVLSPFFSNNPIPIPVTFETIRSGNRNQLTAPGQSVASLENPMLSNDLSQSQVLDASVNTYSEFWFGVPAQVEPCDETEDADCDGILDGDDNCPYEPNPEQDDCDSDGIGDDCETCGSIYICRTPDPNDSDGDGISDAQDSCICKTVLAYIGGFPDHDDNGVIDSEDEFPCESPALKTEKGDSGSRYKPNQKNKSASVSRSIDVAAGASDFQSGIKGIFRQKSTLKYKTDRNYTDPVDGSGTPISYEQKGTYNDGFKMYNWNDWVAVDNVFQFNGTAEQKKWLEAEEITNYSPTGIARESKNALDIYSSVLLAPLGVNYNRNILERYVHPTTVLAKLGNARYFESANTSFELYENPMSNYENYPENGTHFNFAAISESWQSCEVYNIIEPFDPGVVNSTAIINIDIPYHPNLQLEDAKMEICLNVDNEGNTETMSADIISAEDIDGSSYTKLTVNITNNCSNLSSEYYGRASIIKGIELPVLDPLIEYTDVDNFYKHTGGHSLKIPMDQCFNQPWLQIVPDKLYHFSAWVSDGDNTNYDLKPDGVQIALGGSTFEPSGNKIEGWQKIEGDFVYSGTADFVPTICISKGSISGSLYLDDVRLYPTEGQMESYVYDNQTHQLLFTLDDNNYFTKYIYNRDGDLISIQKETERGVKTIQENRKNLIE